MKFRLLNNKLIALLVFFQLTGIAHSDAQIIVGKIILDRKLEWSDFQGSADNTSPFSAVTNWGVSFRYKVDSFHADTAFPFFQTSPVFNNYSSWVKKNQKSNELLQHEQGHYDLAIICAEMMKENFISNTFLRSNLSIKADSIFQSTLQLIKQIEVQYDDETNHMLNRDEQEKWNANIEKLLEKISKVKQVR